MKLHYIPRLVAAALAFLPGILSAQTADSTVLIDEKTGGFESALDGRWFRGFGSFGSPNGDALATKSIEVVNDASSASTGNGYLKVLVSGDPKGRMAVGKLCMNLKPIDLGNGRVFTLSFDARAAEGNGFKNVSPELIAMTRASGAVSVASVMVSSAGSALASEKWTQYKVLFTMPETVSDLEYVQLRISLVADSTKPDTTYGGSLDNVVLTQSK